MKGVDGLFVPVVERCLEMKVEMEGMRSSVVRVFSRYENRRLDDGDEIIKNLVFKCLEDLCGVKNRLVDGKEIKGMGRRLRLF